MIYLDTNVILWLAANELDLISQSVLDIIDESDDLAISPMVVLELEYLHEIERITKKPQTITNHLEENLGISIDDRSLLSIVNVAKSLTWTRDPFDRLITAHAALGEEILITKDKRIRENYKHALW